MRKLAIASAMFLAFAQGPAFAEVVVTGNNGGTIEKSRECTRVEGQADCVTGTTYTSADGKVATKSRVRSTVPGASSIDITLTGPDGNTKTRKRLVTWGN